MIRLPVLLLLLAGLIGCSRSTRTRRVDMSTDDEIMGTGIESADVESMEQFARDLVGHPELTGPHVEGRPTITIFPVENNTRFDFDGELFVRRIRQQLIEKAQGRIRFVTRSKRDLAMIEKERVEKRAGEYTSSRQATKTGADFYLTGTAAAISKVAGSRASDAIWIDFRLVDAETGDLIWEKAYKTKKVGKAGVIYR